MAIPKLSIVGRTYRHIDRYRRILTVLMRYGFGDLLTSLKLDQYVELGLKLVAPRRLEQIETLSRAERIRMALEDLGPTFIKMGQVLSTRPDLVPLEFLEELERLQDRVEPFDFEDVEATIREELGGPMEATFERFDREPVASASLGQVHRARLATGEEVVVKVQRPRIRRLIEVDLEILMHLAGLLERHVEGWDTHRPTRIVEEFARTLQAELDYNLEASHMERFAWQFAGDPTVRVPRVYRELTGRRILTTEYVAGVKPSSVERLREAGLDPVVIARRGATALMKQVFVHGFFHADPHPGNLFILPDNVVCFLDFGMMGRVDRRSREDFADLIMAVVQRDPERAADAVLQFTEWDDRPDRALLVRDIDVLMDRHFSRRLREIELGPMLLDALDAVARHQLRIPPNVFLMLKAMSTVEALGNELDPEFDITRAAAPFLRRIQLARLDPRRVAGDLYGTGSELMTLLRDLPGELRELVRQARSGRLKVEFVHQRLDPLTSALERVSNRLSFALVLASLVIGSALIVLSGVPPRWREIPIIGVLGFVFAGIMGFWLLISILRHGKM